MKRLVIAIAMLALATPALAQQISIPNQGGTMEGHTPRGFRGMGTGIFVGDDLNPNFPAGDGVQAFLTFAPLPERTVTAATLTSQQVKISGNPFRDLGALQADVIAYDRFSPDVWNLQPTATACIFPIAANGTIACDVTTVLNAAIADGRPSLQVRLRLATAADNDGTQDMVMFFATNANQNQPGLFTLDIVPAD